MHEFAHHHDARDRERAYKEVNHIIHHGSSDDHHYDSSSDSSSGHTENFGGWMNEVHINSTLFSSGNILILFVDEGWNNWQQ